MKKLCYILAISLLAISCKKDRTINFSGKVYDPITGEGIEGIEMQLIETRGADLQDPFQTNLDAVEIIQSDANGNFEIEYAGWNRYGYYILTNYESSSFRMVGWENGGDEIKNVGVYFLFGYDDEKAKPIAYIGEAEDCYNRLKQHNQKKDFWTHAIVIVTKTSTSRICAIWRVDT